MSEVFVPDLPGGLEAKLDGMILASMGDEEILAHCRVVAYHIAEQKGTVTSDDVRFAVHLPPMESNMQNWMGSMFNDKRFRFTGNHVRSKIKKSHGRLIMVWELSGE